MAGMTAVGTPPTSLAWRLLYRVSSSFIAYLSERKRIMKMKTAGAFSALSLALAFSSGCGAPDDGAGADEGSGSDSDQAIVARGSTHFSYGTRTAVSASACDLTSAGQICYVPETKAIRWSFDGSAVSQADADAVLGRADDTFTSLARSLSGFGWTFTQVPTTQRPVANLQIFANDNRCTGTKLDVIDGYVCHFRTLGEHAVHYTIKLHRGSYFVKLFPFFRLASSGSGELPVRLEHPYTITALPARSS